MGIFPGQKWLTSAAKAMPSAQDREKSLTLTKLLPQVLFWTQRRSDCLTKSASEAKFLFLPSSFFLGPPPAFLWSWTILAPTAAFCILDSWSTAWMVFIICCRMSNLLHVFTSMPLRMHDMFAAQSVMSEELKALLLSLILLLLLLMSLLL